MQRIEVITTEDSRILQEVMLVTSEAPIPNRAVPTKTCTKEVALCCNVLAIGFVNFFINALLFILQQHGEAHF